MKLLITLILILSVLFNVSYGESGLNKEIHSSPALSNSHRVNEFVLPWFLVATPVDIQLFTAEVFYSVKKSIMENKVNSSPNVCIRGVIDKITGLAASQTFKSAPISINSVASLVQEVSKMCGFENQLSKIADIFTNALKNGIQTLPTNLPAPHFNGEKITQCFKNTFSFSSDRSAMADQVGKCIASIIMTD